ncbi:MAG: ATP-binding protein [Candidatus Wallbacteria bacterium]|nr:ATP-binding protein [Candidatus Wallbacteria bacterium]
MLIEFRVGNYLSFKEQVCFSLVASKLKQLPENVFLASSKLKLLKSSAIYGPNASGKTNLIKAMEFMRMYVLNSSKETQAGEPIPVRNFRLSTETEHKPSSFEVTFIHENVRYRYGFEADTEKIHSEWLYSVPNKREIKLFSRESTNFEITAHFKEANDLVKKKLVRENALLISVAAQFNGLVSMKIINWFKDKLRFTSGLADNTIFTMKYFEQNKEEMVDFLKMADLSIDDVSVVESQDFPGVFDKFKPAPEWIEKLKEEILKVKTFYKFKSFHKKFDQKGQVVSHETFDFNESESDGTKKLFFTLAGPILDTLRNGRTLVIDELDSQLHPLIILELVKLFNTVKTNPTNAQLVFVTNNTGILDRKYLRRDQIWFCEKKEYGNTDLYSLIEYQVRHDASYGKDYLLGRYGGIPFLGDFGKLVRRGNGKRSDIPQEKKG